MCEFICSLCGKSFNLKSSYSNHIKWCKENDNSITNYDKLECAFCHKNFDRPCALSVHEKHCRLNPNRFITTKDGWQCCHCEEVFVTRRELQEHKLSAHAEYCGKHAWNKGLTKDTCDIIKQQAERYSENVRSGKIKQADHHLPWTEERRKAQSDRKKKLYLEHPEKHPNARVSCNKSKMTYPEQVAYDWLISHQLCIEHNKLIVSDSFRRYVDFFVPQFNLIIEIDGEYWHSKSIDTDRLKDIEADALGFTTLRIIPKDGVERQLEIYFHDKIGCDIQPISEEAIIKYDLKKQKELDHALHISEAGKKGLLDTKGRLNANKISHEEMNFRKETILNSDVDLSKFGWVEKVSKVTGLTRRQIYKVVNSTDLINYVYRRIAGSNPTT